MNQQTIFISIASYRDPELLNTIDSLINNAKLPENLRITIGWQHDSKDVWDYIPEQYLQDNRFKILDIDYTQSRGVCNVRKLIQAKYNNEKYYLQIDSHHRFIPDWDVILIESINELSALGHKPIITGYLPSLELSSNVEVKHFQQYEMFIAYYVYDKIPVFSAKPAKSLAKYNESKFLSGHFIFTDGAFCLDILYDEDYYFLGEEYNLSARAFTHGYEFFTTGKIICWHEYIRKNKPKHRSDHRPDFIQQRRYDAYLKHMEMFIHRRNVPIKYFGNEKKLRDYEKWIGLDERRTVP